jgi:predicted transcriptional regulator
MSKDDLSSQELEILRILWNESALKPAEIQERLTEPIKNSALRWQLTALVEKGLVARRRRGKVFLYRSAEASENVFGAIVRRMARTFSGGSAVALVGRILETEEELSDDEVRELIAIAKKRSTRSQK